MHPITNSSPSISMILKFALLFSQPMTWFSEMSKVKYTFFITTCKITIIKSQKANFSGTLAKLPVLKWWDSIYIRGVKKVLWSCGTYHKSIGTFCQEWGHQSRVLKSIGRTMKSFAEWVMDRLDVFFWIMIKNCGHIEQLSIHGGTQKIATKDFRFWTITMDTFV